ncbi:uncharacterized protein LOC111667981 [Seriola lalandi dorsalis]|uniref:uncharacterized protein LOC111667981 n=1 Tax=Seriola lalandi dorsalis TaxID=1841481 RepID=UPI000C6F616F|nr:uncharacterized protein LOC111667981 [Seriola lalandi dorsalis]
MAPTSSEESAIMVAEYNLIYDAELWKLISQVRDPQYTGETFSSKSGFMQFIGSTIEYERSVPDDEQDEVQDNNEQDTYSTGPSSEVAHPLATAEKATADDGTQSPQVISDLPVYESPPPMIEQMLSSGTAPYRETKYTFEVLALEATTDSDDEWVVVSVSDTEDDNLRYSPDSLIDYRPMSPHSAMVLEARASSPESATSVNEFRRLSPDSPLPEFTIALPECVRFLRSASSSPETVASDIDYMPQTYRPMLPESTMQIAERRASSPESMPEFNENRSLSPDSPIPQFTASLEEYTSTQRSSSPESAGSDSECELMVTSSRAAETERPSSPESISSINEFRKLLPDSPVPEFMRILSSYFMDGSPCDRSSSPMSLSSDFEFVALPIDCWIDDSPRPLSPETAESEEELGFCCEETSRLVSKPKLLHHGTSSLLPEQHSSFPNKIQTNETMSKEGNVNPAGQISTGSELEILSYDEWMQRGSQVGSISTLQTSVSEENFPVKPSPAQDINRKEEKILYVRAGELKSKTASQRAPVQTPEETHFQIDNEVQSKLLSATTAAQDTSKIGVDDKPMKPVPLQLPDPNSYTTHRAVTPVLPSFENTLCEKSHRFYGFSDSKLSPEEAQSSELFSPMSSQFLVPPDYEAVFSGHQTLRVSECSQASLKDLSPVSPVFSDSAQVVTEATTKRESEAAEDFEFSPDFNRVLSEFEKTILEFESDEPKMPPKVGSESPQHSDSDLEFFDCRQAFSDFSEPEEVKLEPEISYHIFEPPSPAPGSSPDVGFLKGSPQHAAHPFLRVDDYKRFSSGSESLGEFAYDSEGSRGCRTEGDLPVCEELPSRDQAGYYNDDDFLGRVRG